MATPFGEPLAEHQGVVTKSQNGLQMLSFRHRLHVVDFVGQLVKRRVTVDFVVGRVEQDVLLIRARCGDGVCRDDPNAHTFLATRVHVTRILMAISASAAWRDSTCL